MLMIKKLCRMLLACMLFALLMWAETVSVYAIDKSHQCDEDATVSCYADGNQLIAECSSCGEQYDATVSIDMQDGSSFNCTGVKIKVSDAGWKDIGAEDYVVLYEGSGETDYPISDVVPTASGTYTVSLSLRWLWDSEEFDMVEMYRTTPITFTVNDHDWQYKASGYSIVATCKHCGEKASVTIDTSAVYEASRNCDTTALQYEIFYENNWSCHKNIAHYNVLYYGYETISKSQTRQYVRTTQRPVNAGNYTVKLALLTDEDDTDSAYCSTMEKPFYVADISINQCEVKEYGPTQIANFTEPKRNSIGRLCVGTASELLWCVYHMDPGDDIWLTNDIIVNPITVTDEGKIRSASYQIYKWEGIGTESKEFTGTIFGNGYRIYGLYHPEKDSKNSSGFINAAYDCAIYELTVENSMLVNSNAAAIIGRYRATDNTVTHQNDWVALNSYINAENTAGGLIGLYRADNGGYTATWFDDCYSNCRVSGTWSGGLIGGVDESRAANKLYIDHCANYGDITAVKYDGGGLIGKLEVRKDGSVRLTNCINTGTINGKSYAGGIIGYYYSNGSCVTLRNCTSIGYIDVTSGVKSGICGASSGDYYTNGAYQVSENYYYDAPRAYGKAPESFGDAELLTKKQIKDGFICQKYGHKSEMHFSNVVVAGCETDGSMEKKCMVCGKVLSKQNTKAHGHYYEYGTCIYCGKSNNVIGSMVYRSSPIVLAVTGCTLVIAAVIVAVMKKRQHK